MGLKIVEKKFSAGDLVTLKYSKKKEHYCIIGFKYDGAKQEVAILKALYNDTYIIEKPVSELKSLLTRGEL